MRFVFLLIGLMFAVTPALAADDAVKEIDDNALPWLSSDEQPQVKHEKKEEATKLEPILDFRLVYSPIESHLAQEHLQLLDLALEQVKNGQSKRRIVLKSYASARKGHVSEPRRIALKRATEVRQYLVEKGYSQRNISLQILGTEADEAPYDRIDLLELP